MTKELFSVTPIRTEDCNSTAPFPMCHHVKGICPSVFCRVTNTSQPQAGDKAHRVCRIDLSKVCCRNASTGGMKSRNVIHVEQMVAARLTGRFPQLTMPPLSLKEKRLEEAQTLAGPSQPPRASWGDLGYEDS